MGRDHECRVEDKFRCKSFELAFVSFFNGGRKCAHLFRSVTKEIADGNNTKELLIN